MTGTARSHLHAPQARRAPALVWLAVGLVGFCGVPWYVQTESALDFAWIREWPGARAAPALLQAALHGHWSLWPLGAAFAALAVVVGMQLPRRARGSALLAIAGSALAWLVAQGFLAADQPGMGVGATATATSFAMLAALGLADRGALKGDAFANGCLVAVALLVVVFTFYPVLRILASAFENAVGAWSVSAFAGRLFAAKVWSLGCVAGGTRCGVAWNTLLLGVLCATLSTALGLVFALLLTRTRSRYRRALRALSVLPIITPPFVIGFGLILLFGRSGVVNHALEWALGVTPTRWIYGLPGVLLAQVFAFTPIAFLVLIGVVEGVSPTLEEAAQTLRADRLRTLIDVSLPLMRPGLVNAFLISFIESIADFGNPILLGGNFGVLSTEVFFSVVGAQLDQGRAATLGLVLLLFALVAFVLQRRLIGRKVYAVLSGKGDTGLPTLLPDGLRRACYAIALPWVVLTIALYAIALCGGFVQTWGRDYTPTLRHYATAFGVEWGPHGVLWTGAAWTSFWTTVRLSAIAAPLTAALGILAAWLLTRQRFAGQGAFEFGTMLSFAIPGTVIGVSYILAFNVPPVEITGTALILVACNVFRNMPVGVRAGVAAMAQIDRSLDEASVMLGARGFTALRTILLPLLKPAVVAALVYSFVRAMTTVSAVIFLVSAQYEWSTTYIINRVVNGDYGVALAYSAVLIVLMLVVIAGIHVLVGTRRLGRREAADAPSARMAGLAGTSA